MSRSKHTRPYEIRAADRVRAPYEPRGRGNPSADHAASRALKGLGVVLDAARRASPDEEPPLPRLVVKRPRPGRIHPLSRADVVAALRFFGESCVYGLRSISLVRGESPSAAGQVRLGAYVAPGRVLLFDQPASPWQLAGALSPAVARRLVRAGASVEDSDGGLRTVVAWPGETLRDFVLFDGLMHEIGHHVLQHARGKRGVRVLRTKDHEALADRFAQRCRALYRARESPGG